MTLDILVLPTSVSFYNIEIIEIAGPATDINGYFDVGASSEA